MGQRVMSKNREYITQPHNNAVAFNAVTRNFQGVEIPGSKSTLYSPKNFTLGAFPDDQHAS
jgi:hypothetical protein